MKVLLILVLALGLVGCSEQTLTQQDNSYYKSMDNISDEYMASINELYPVFESYSKDNSKTKELNVSAEKFRKKLIALQKKISTIKPISGFENNHELIVNAIGHMKDFSEDLIRISNGENNLMNKTTANDFQRGYNDSVKFVIDLIKQRSGNQ